MAWVGGSVIFGDRAPTPAHRFHSTAGDPVETDIRHADLNYRFQCKLIGGPIITLFTFFVVAPGRVVVVAFIGFRLKQRSSALELIRRDKPAVT
jgi:hypothetical protein